MTLTTPLSADAAKALMNAAQSAAQHAHVPYSQFRVGAALLTTEDKIIDGCNVENVSYGLTQCAERTAICNAISSGLKTFKAIAVWAEKPAHNAVVPCGACLQVLIEFLTPDTPVVAYDATGELRQWPISALLPKAFTSLK